MTRVRLAEFWFSFRLVLACGAVITCLSAAVRADDGRIAYLALTDGYWQAWVMNADGSGAHQVTSSDVDKDRCSWDPSGREILVNSLDGEQFHVAIDTRVEVPVRLPQSGSMDAVLSPNGRRIAYSLSATGAVDSNDIWVADADGGPPQRLTNMPGLQHAPAWTPDGKWIYFLSGAETKQAHNVWRLSLDGRMREQLTAGTLYHFGVSPAGDGRVAYSSNRSGNYEIFVQKDSAPAVQWTADPALDASPTWGPRGKSIAFHSTRSGRPQIFRIDEPKGKALALTRHEGGARDPVWWVPRQTQ